MAPASILYPLFSILYLHMMTCWCCSALAAAITREPSSTQREPQRPVPIGGTGGARREPAAAAAGVVWLAPAVLLLYLPAAAAGPAAAAASVIACGGRMPVPLCSLPADILFLRSRSSGFRRFATAGWMDI